MHQAVKDIYSWRQVAERTERVYNFSMQQPGLNAFHRLKSNFSWGPVVGIYAVFYQMLEFLVLFLLDFIQPEDEIDI